MHRQRANHFLLIAAWVLIVGIKPVTAQTPLHEQIDSLVGFGNPKADLQFAPAADDATFLRRVSLDLTGRIPTSKTVREFLAKSSPDKRERLVDQLLHSPEYARHMQYAFDVMLMERRPDKHIKAELWQNYLRKSFADNKPWDQLTLEILTADGSEKATGAAAKFLLDREMKQEDVTRDLGRVFLGRDLQCAQCHDHPTIEDYRQRHYYGLSAFLNRSYVFTDRKTKKVLIGEKAEGVVKFTSVFTMESGETPPRVLDLPAIEDPAVAGDPYQVKPTKTAAGVPIYSRRLKLARLVTDPANIAFRQNIVNRLWAMMMGRGLVEPVDMWSQSNPPTNPELLDLLAKSFADHNYDVRYFLRELALSKTYQLSSEQPSGFQESGQNPFQQANLKPLSPEQLAWSMMEATGLVTKTQATLKTKPDQQSQESALHNALKGHVQTFIGFFGTPGVQTSQFNASANQALFLKNGSLLQTWLVPSGDNLTARLAKLDSSKLIEELYLSVFSRYPNEIESQTLIKFFEDNKTKRETAIQQFTWAALTSAEFRFNH